MEATKQDIDFVNINEVNDEYWNETSDNYNAWNGIKYHLNDIIKISTKGSFI